MPGPTDATPVAEPLPTRQPGAALAPDTVDSLRPAFGFSWADPDSRPAAWAAFGEPTDDHADTP
jgi:hypothetical protein